MREVTGDIFKLMYQADAICITTNGVVKSNKELVMGAGIALKAKQEWPGLDAQFGKLVLDRGNKPNVVQRELNTDTCELQFILVISYPTKHHWKDDSDLNLIYHGAYALKDIADKRKLERILLTRPGCGLGRLSWENAVKPVISPILDDRFTVVSN